MASLAARQSPGRRQRWPRLRPAAFGFPSSATVGLCVSRIAERTAHAPH
jgi:hypothetical protein